MTQTETGLVIDFRAMRFRKKLLDDRRVNFFDIGTPRRETKAYRVDQSIGLVLEDKFRSFVKFNWRHIAYLQG